MTPHAILSRTLLVLGITACISTMPAQNTPTSSGQSGNQAGQTSGQSSNTDRQSTRSGSDTTDRNTQSNSSSTSATSGDRTHAGAQAGSERNRADGTELMVGQPDLKFMNEAAQSGLMEVQAATIAQQKAQSDEVKNFAKKLLDDHTKANQELQALAAQKNVSLPTEMGPKHQSHIAKMQNLSDAEFDRKWMKMQVDHHKKDVKEFQRHADRSMDSHVKAFAEKQLPTLQQHLQTAQNLQQSGTRSRTADTPRDSTSNNSSDSTSGKASDTTGRGAESNTDNQKQNDATQKPQGQNNPTTQR